MLNIIVVVRKIVYHLRDLNKSNFGQSPKTESGLLQFSYKVAAAPYSTLRKLPTPGGTNH